MNQIDVVRGGQRFGYLYSQVKYLLEVQWSSCESGPQRFTADVFGDDEVNAVTVFNRVDGNDIWMI